MEVGYQIPFHTNSIDMIHINADAKTNSILKGVNTICTCEHEFCFFFGIN